MLVSGVLPRKVCNPMSVTVHFHTLPETAILLKSADLTHSRFLQPYLMLPGKPYLAPLLALILTISQWALVLHEYDLHAHESGADCQLCLHAHSGKAAIPAGALGVTAIVATAWLPAASVPHPRSRPALVRHARAPPHVLSLAIV